MPSLLFFRTQLLQQNQRGNRLFLVSDSEAIQTEPQLETPSLGRFALLAMTDGRVFPDRPQDG
jgi:hypothetical protein